MTRPFDYFVILADMRTGSNFLEKSLNQLEDVHCYGEAFNARFIRDPITDSLFGIDMPARDRAPMALIDALKTNTDGLPGFRFFNDHDQRVFQHVVDDPRCAKIVLGRNPLDSYVSLKVAQKTDQWKLAEAKGKRSALVKFSLTEFQANLTERQNFRLEIMGRLQKTGQTPFVLDYEDLGDTDILNGVASFLGSTSRMGGPSKSIKKQNPDGLEEVVLNYDQMVLELATIPSFGLDRVQDFERRRGPNVPSFYVAAKAPLLYLPISAGPNDAALTWLAALDGVDRADLKTGLTQKDLRSWKRETPGHRSFTIISHPAERAHRAFCAKILPKTDEYEMLRRVVSTGYGVDIPLDGDLSNYSATDHRAAFAAFLKFLKSNLSGQTSARIDPSWASLTSVLEGFSTVVIPDRIIREDEAADQLRRLAKDLGLDSGDFPKTEAEQPYSFADIYDKSIEKLAQAAYRKDYINFGFGPWSVTQGK